jgi:hypothetical protein
VDETEIKINVLGAARATGAPLDGGGVVFRYALLRMRPQSISWAECSVVISCGKSTTTNLAGETIDARCVDCIYIYIYTYICMIDRRIQWRET